MRKLILFMHMSLDGYVAAIDENVGWTTGDSGVFEAVVPELIHETDTLLLGRIISDELLDYWLHAEANEPDLPEGEIAYARWATKAHKVIFSKMNEKMAWKNTELQVVKNDQDMVRAVAGLKKQPGKNIVVHGGVRTAQNLVRLDLVDEYQLVVHPVVLGSGLSLFKTMNTMLKLELIREAKLRNGVVFLRYRPINVHA